MIYLIRAEETNLYKIGYTANSPETRMESLQTGCPYKLVLYEHMNGSMDREKWLHETFKEYRKHGEWFEFDEETVKKVCKKMLSDRRDLKTQLKKQKEMCEETLRDSCAPSLRYLLYLAVLEIVSKDYDSAIQRILEFNLLIYGEGMRPSCVPRLTEKIIGIQKEEK